MAVLLVSLAPNRLMPNGDAGTTVCAEDIDVLSLRPDRPKNLKASASSSVITVSWDKVEGAAKYTVAVYDHKTRSYNDILSTPRNKVTFFAVPGHSYGLAVFAEKDLNGLSLNGQYSKRITVRTKCSDIYDYPDMADYGFPDLEPDVAIKVAKTLPGSFGSILEYDDDTNEDTVTEMTEKYIKAMKKKGFAFEEAEVSDTEGYRSIARDYSYKGIKAGMIVVHYYEDRAFAVLIPHDFFGYPYGSYFFV